MCGGDGGRVNRTEYHSLTRHRAVRARESVCNAAALLVHPSCVARHEGVAERPSLRDRRRETGGRGGRRGVRGVIPRSILTGRGGRGAAHAASVLARSGIIARAARVPCTG